METSSENARLKAGLKFSQSVVIRKKDSAVAFGSGTVDVYGTPAMIAFMENTCKNCVQPLLSEGEGTVGIEVQVRHLAAAPIGATVSCSCEVIAIDRRFITFQVSVMLGDETIGNGTHKRAIVNVEKFQAKADEKKKLLNLPI